MQGFESLTLRCVKLNRFKASDCGSEDHGLRYADKIIDFIVKSRLAPLWWCSQEEKALVCKTNIVGSNPIIISQSQKYLTVHTTCAIMNIEQKAQLPIIYAAKHTPQNKIILKNLQRDSERIYFLSRVFLYKKKRPANASLFKCLQWSEIYNYVTYNTGTIVVFMIIREDVLSQII